MNDYEYIVRICLALLYPPQALVMSPFEIGLSVMYIVLVSLHGQSRKRMGKHTPRSTLLRHVTDGFHQTVCKVRLDTISV